jgi:hypothetical protein
VTKPNPAHAASATDDTSETSDEDFLAEYRKSYGRTELRDSANPFLNGFPPIPRVAALSLIGEVMYAAQMPDGLIKIGHTTNLQQRLRHQNLHGSTLLAIKRGTYDDEQVLHDSLATHAHHAREWYWPADPVLDLINDWRQALGMAPLDRDQFTDVHPESERSTYGRGPRGRFARRPLTAASAASNAGPTRSKP